MLKVWQILFLHPTTLAVLAYALYLVRFPFHGWHSTARDIALSAFHSTLEGDGVERVRPSVQNNRSIKIRDLFSSFKPTSHARPYPLLYRYMCYCRDCSGMNFFFTCRYKQLCALRCYFRNGSFVKPSSKPSNYSSSRCRTKLGPFRCQIKFSSPKFHCCLIILRTRPSRGMLQEKFRDIFFCLPSEIAVIVHCSQR